MKKFGHPNSLLLYRGLIGNARSRYDGGAVLGGIRGSVAHHVQFNALRGTQDAMDQLARQCCEVIGGIGLVGEVIAVNDRQGALARQQSAEHIWHRSVTCGTGLRYSPRNSAADPGKFMAM